MPLRFYLSPWVDVSGPDESPQFTPTVALAIEAEGPFQWQAIELRIKEERATLNGWCLVISDLPNAAHNSVKGEGFWVRPGFVQRAEIAGLIGEEGIPATVDLSSDEAVLALAHLVHQSRVGRWRQ